MRTTKVVVLAGVALAFGGAARGALVFNFTGNVNQQMMDGFVAAGQRWSSHFSNDMTVNVTLSASALGASSIANTAPSNVGEPYSSVRSALIADATSSDDLVSASYLPSGPGFNFLTNDFSTGNVVMDNNGSNNNTTLRLTRANAKALGFVDPHSTSSDATIIFNSSLNYDFDPSDGIAPNAVDFVGVATHELGHALGFISGVDIVDTDSKPNGLGVNFQNAVMVTPIDLFRYTSASFAQGLNDESTTGASYFSIDGGADSLALFSTGVKNGDGQQASHWKRLSGTGIMDPTFSFGQFRDIQPVDVRAFDVMGYTIVPEPTGVGIAIGAMVLVRRRRSSIL